MTRWTRCSAVPCRISRTIKQPNPSDGLYFIFAHDGSDPRKSSCSIPTHGRAGRSSSASSARASSRRAGRPGDLGKLELGLTNGDAPGLALVGGVDGIELGPPRARAPGRRQRRRADRVHRPRRPAPTLERRRRRRGPRSTRRTCATSSRSAGSCAACRPSTATTWSAASSRPPASTRWCARSCALGRSAVLTLIRGLRRGEIRFYRGEVTSAQVGLIHGQAAFHQLLLWTDARFDFAHEDIVRRQQIPLSPDELFADAERFLEGVRESAELLSPSMVLEQDAQRVHELGKQIPTEVHGVLRMFDGHRVLADILEDSPYRVFETLRVAQKAIEAGLLRPVAEQRPKTTWRAVLAIEEWLVGSETRDAVRRAHGADRQRTGRAHSKPKFKKNKRKQRADAVGERAGQPVGAQAEPTSIGARSCRARSAPRSARCRAWCRRLDAHGEIDVATRDKSAREARGADGHRQARPDLPDRGRARAVGRDPQRGYRRVGEASSGRPRPRPMRRRPRPRRRPPQSRRPMRTRNRSPRMQPRKPSRRRCEGEGRRGCQGQGRRRCRREGQGRRRCEGEGRRRCEGQGRRRCRREGQSRGRGGREGASADARRRGRCARAKAQSRRRCAPRRPRPTPTRAAAAKAKADADAKAKADADAAAKAKAEAERRREGRSRRRCRASRRASARQPIADVAAKAKADAAARRDEAASDRAAASMIATPITAAADDRGSTRVVVAEPITVAETSTATVAVADQDDRRRRRRYRDGHGDAARHGRASPTSEAADGTPRSRSTTVRAPRRRDARTRPRARWPAGEANDRRDQPSGEAAT